MSRSWIICHHAPEPSAPDITAVSRGCHYATSVDHQARSVYADVNCCYYFTLVYTRNGGRKQRLFADEEAVRYGEMLARLRVHVDCLVPNQLFIFLALVKPAENITHS